MREVTNNIKTVNSLETLYKKASQHTTLFSSTEDTQQEIQSFCKDITSSFRNNQLLIKSLEKLSLDLPPVEHKVVENAERSCVAELSNMSKQFRQRM